MPPSAGLSTAVAAEHLNRRRLGAGCAVVGLALVVAALVVGLGGPPADLWGSPNVLAAVVLARAIMGVGMLGVGVVLLRMGERWFTLGLSERADPPSMHP
jgi:hypothetical protein